MSAHGAAGPDPVRIFVSYAHQKQDIIWRKRLMPLLQFRSKPCVGYAWHDQELSVGCRWDEEIREKLEEMDVFICLVSHNFYASSYIMDVEYPLAKERHEKGEIEIVPILLEDFNLDEDLPYLKTLNPLPEFGKWWSQYNPRSNAHRSIRDGIRDIIKKILSKEPETGLVGGERMG